jgi:molecular chaperone DnaK (HSP70)
MLKPNTKDSTLLKCFKLHLSDNQEYGELPPLTVGSETIDPIRPIADYLQRFHQYVMEELRKGFANNYDPERFRYCLTVPAIWSDMAKASMREAAIRSGIISRDDPVERLILISEPEAAALYCEKRSESWNLQHGDKFMIVDAGGGTVDLIV